MFDLGFLQATANVPTNWLGLSVLAAIVSGIVAFGVAVYNARNARTSLDEGRAYTERLTRVNPYIELLQLSMHQCMDLSTIIDAIQRHPFSSKLQLLRLENSGGAQVWGETGVQLSRLRFSIVLVLQSQQAVLSFLEKTAQLSVTQAEALDRVKEGRMEEFIAQRQDYMKVAVEIIDLVRVETRKQQDRDHVESFSLNDAQIQQLLLQGALSELKFKLLPADFFWAAWWGFDDLTGPGEEDSDVAVFLPVFTRLEAILKKKRRTWTFGQNGFSMYQGQR